MIAYPHLKLDALKSIRLFDQLPVLFDVITTINKQQTRQHLEMTEQQLLLQFLFENLSQHHPFSSELKVLVQLQGEKNIYRLLTTAVANIKADQLTHIFTMLCRKVAFYLPGLLEELVSAGLVALRQVRENELDEKQQQKLVLYRNHIQPIAIRIGNQQFEQNAERFKETWSGVHTAEQKHAVLQSLLAKQNALIETYSDKLSTSNREINLQHLDFTSVSFAYLDLIHANINHGIFNQADLSQARCTARQFLQVYHLQDTRFNPEVEQGIAETKQRFLKEKLPNLSLEIQEIEAFIATIADLSHLACDGFMPDFNMMTDECLKLVLDAALKNFFLNTLPPDDEYSQVRFCEGNKTLTRLSGHELLQVMERLLQSRNFQFSKDVVAYAQHQSISVIYEQVSNHWDTLSDMEQVLQSMPTALQNEFKEILTQLKQTVRSMKQNKEALKRQYEQGLINAFIECIFKEPDALLSCGPIERLESALSTARKKDHLIVDLRNTDLSKLQFTKYINFRKVHVLLTKEQEQALPRLQLQQRYARLARAIEKENIAEIAICMTQGLNPNHADEQERTLFMSACFNNKPLAVRCLLRHGADIHLKTADGWLIIESVARTQLHDVVDILIEKGAKLDFTSGVYLGDISRCEFQESDVHRPDRTGDLPLHIAVRGRSSRLVAQLLDLHADVNQPSARGQRTALSIAVDIGHLDTIELLLRRGATVQPADVRRACESNQRPIAQLLRKSIAQIDLYTAIYLGELDIAKKIIQENYDDEFDGFTPLAIACRTGNIHVIEWLLDKGANAYLPSKGQLPMSHAMELSHVNVVVFLIEKGVSATAMIQHKMPPLFYAVSENKVIILEAILKLQNSQGKPWIWADYEYQGRTALVMAAQKGYDEIVGLLLAAGANPFATDESKSTSLHYAALNKRPAMLLQLMKAMLSISNDKKQTVFDILAQAQKSPISMEYFQAVLNFFEHGPIMLHKVAESQTELELVSADKVEKTESEAIVKPVKKSFHYIRYEVGANDDCGYMVFHLKRLEAYHRLIQHIDSIRELLVPAVQEALITAPFIDYLHRTGVLAEDISAFDVQDDLERCSQELAIIRAYLNYDVIEKHIDTGWAHPAVLQALASIQSIPLYLWQLDSEGKLVPHVDARFASFNPKHPSQKPTHLLFVNQNHFERLDFEYFYQQQPAPIPANKNIAQLIAKYGAMSAPNSPVTLTIHLGKQDGTEEMLSLKKK